jgi:predicted glycosyltransferase involved in capsule biosynthesis
LINLTKYKAIGGENENFKSHGFDDVERIYRVLKFGNSIYWSDYFAYHLWHPRNKKDHYYEPQQESKDEFIRIVKMNLDELQNEVMSWRGFSS